MDDDVCVWLNVPVTDEVCDCVGVPLQPSFDASSSTPPYSELELHDNPLSKLTYEPTARPNPTTGSTFETLAFVPCQFTSGAELKTNE